MLRLALALILLASTAVAAPDAKQLAQDRVAAAEKVYQGTVAASKVGGSTPETAYTWSVRWLDAELATGKTIKQALADHLARMTALETDVSRGYKTGRVSSHDHAAAMYFRIEAELWVVRGKR